MNIAFLQLLAQATTAAAPPSPVPQTPAPSVPAGPAWISLDTIFWFTIFLIFIITIVSALIRRLSKDKTLKLFHDYHIAFFSEKRQSLWGDCLVASQGIELLFDSPFTTRRKLVKSSALLYEDEFIPMICLTRSIHGLNEEELRDRKLQIHRTFKPGVGRRIGRWFRNMLNTLQDAFSKTMTLVIGRMSAGMANAAGAAVTSQARDLGNLTTSAMGLAANAYEPLLERYIGQPVVVEINLPAPPGPPPPPGWMPDTAEFPGYLVDYSQKFLAVFNVDHVPLETFELVLEVGKAAAPEVPGVKIDVNAQDTIIRCEGRDGIVLRRITSQGQSWELGIALIPGTSVILAAMTEKATITIERTRQIDLILPRSRARIRFGSMPVRPSEHPLRNWIGLAPVQERLEQWRERVQTMSEQIRYGLTRPIGERKQNDDPDENERKS